MIKACKSCRNLIEIPTNNSYKDVKHFCMVTGYYTSDINKDRSKVRMYTPGGKELICRYEYAEKQQAAE